MLGRLHTATAPDRRGASRACGLLAVGMLLVSVGARAQGRLRVTPLRGAAIQVVNWEIVDDRVRGQRDGNRESWSLSLRRVWLLEPIGALSRRSTDGGPYLVLRSGARLEGTLRGGQDGKFRWKFALGGEGDVPLAFVRGLRIGKVAAGPDGKDDGFKQMLASPPAERDLVFVYDKKGRIKQFGCKVQKVEGDQVHILIRGTSRPLPLTRLHGIVFAQTSGIEAPAEAGAGLAQIRLHDGRTLHGYLQAGSAREGVRFRLLEGAELRLRLSLIKDIELRSDKLVYLSGLEPSPDSRYRALLGRRWPVLRDRGLGGQPLELGTKKFRRGLLVVPEARLHYRLDRPYDRMIGEVGIPRARHGSALLRVLADGRPVGKPLTLKADGKAIPLSLELGKAREVTVEVLATDDLDAGARVILGDLRVVVD